MPESLRQSEPSDRGVLTALVGRAGVENHTIEFGVAPRIRSRKHAVLLQIPACIFARETLRLLKPSSSGSLALGSSRIAAFELVLVWASRLDCGTAMQERARLSCA